MLKANFAKVALIENLKIINFVSSLFWWNKCCSLLHYQSPQKLLFTSIIPGLSRKLYSIIPPPLRYSIIAPMHPAKNQGSCVISQTRKFRHSFFILSFQPPIWYSFKLLSLPKTWDKADKDRNDRTIYNAEIFLVSIVFVDYGLSIGITIHALLVYFSFLPPTTLLLLLL